MEKFKGNLLKVVRHHRQLGLEGHDDAGGVRLLVLALTLTLTLSYLPRNMD